MKKILALFLATLMVLGLIATLASCGDKKPTETKGQETKTETSAPEESKTEASTPEESRTEASTPEESKTEASTPEESKTEETKPEESQTETDTTPPDPVDPVTGNLNTVLSHPWFNFNYSNDRTYNFEESDGLTKFEIIDLAKNHLDCTTPNGWTQILMYYIPSRTPDGSKFTTFDFLSVGSIRSASDGTYNFGLNFCLGNGIATTVSPTTYSPANSKRLMKLTQKDYAGQYVMITQVFTPERNTFYLNGKAVFYAEPTYIKQARIGQASLFHKYMVLNGKVVGDTFEADIVDQYATLGVKLMYATGYAYAADEKAVAAIYNYYAEGNDLPTPEHIHDLIFDDSQFAPTLDETDDRPSNYQNVLSYEYFDFDFSGEGGLKGIKVVDLSQYWKGSLVNGRCSVGLYYIPEADYTDTDYLGLMQNKDYSPHAFGATLIYNLGTGYVENLDHSIANPLIAASKQVRARGWTLFLSSYDGETLNVYCNNELVLQSDLTSTGVTQYYILGCNDDGSPNNAAKNRLMEMVINGYALDVPFVPAGTTGSYVAEDMYEKYGIYMLYAKFYACAPNRNAATDIYNEVMKDLNEYLSKQQ